MPAKKPTPAAALPSPFADPSAITREETPSRADARTGAGTRVRAYTRPGESAQVPAAVGRHVDTEARAVAAAAARLAQRREALAAAVAAARASGVMDDHIQAWLVVAGLSPAEVGEAMA